MPRELNQICSFHAASVLNQRYDPAMRLSIPDAANEPPVFQMHKGSATSGFSAVTDRSRFGRMHPGKGSLIFRLHRLPAVNRMLQRGPVLPDTPGSAREVRVQKQ
jgi:hypothetical protein